MKEYLARNRFIFSIMISFLYCTPAVTEKEELKFVMIGDFGGVPFRPYSTISQRFISQEIAKVRDVDFFMGLGDNFYFDGVKDVNDERFIKTFENVYAYPTELEKDWYMIAGNHDYIGNVSAQILYSKMSKRWMFPHYFYTKVFNIPTTNKTLQIVMIDTMLLCYERKIKDKNAPRPKEQLKWLIHTLENSTADYLIVGGHHPMYSAGIHGSTPCVQQKLENLFNKHRVTAYFSGHDHNLQHIKLENSSVEYFVNGAANFHNPRQLNRYRLEPNSLKKFIGKSNGFLILTATSKHLKVKFVTVRLPAQKYRRLLLPRNQQENQSNNIKYPQLLMAFFQSTVKNYTPS